MTERGKTDGSEAVAEDGVSTAKLRFNQALKLLESRKSSLSSFDKNKDSVIDDEELAEAASTCLDWAAKTKSDDSKWYYSLGSEVHGPTSWKELVSASNHNPDMFITYGEGQVWIPFDVIRSLS
jgi:Ca2+-binding EF-hand superfamily protein